MERKWRYILTVGIILIFIGWIVLLYFVGPSKIVRNIGIENSYIVAFVLGVLGGSSLFTSSAYYTTILALSQQKLDPIVLGIVAGFGLTIGDSAFYLLGNEITEIRWKWFRKKIKKFGKWLREKPQWIILLFSFLYVAVTPLPNDLLMISVGLAKYRYKMIALGVLLGNILFLILLSIFGKYGIKTPIFG